MTEWRRSKWTTTLVVLPNAGHMLIGGNAGMCTREVVEQFLRDPKGTLDTGCTASTSAPAFSDRHVTSVFGTADAWGN